MKKIVIALAVILAAVLCSNDQASVTKHGSECFKIGIAGYTYRSFTIDQALEFVESLGIKYMSVKDFHLPLDATEEEMAAFKEKCAQHGVEPYILGPIYMRSEEDVDRAFAYAGRFGAKMFMGVPDYELLDYTIEKVRTTGIKLAIHTHGPDMPSFPDIRDIVSRVKDPSLGIGCCMDLGHSFRYGQNPARDIVQYKDWIYDIHIKDETAPSAEGKTWEMGRGQMNIPAIMKALKEIGYQGVVSVEFEKNSDTNPHNGVCETVGYLRGVCDALYSK